MDSVLRDGRSTSVLARGFAVLDSFRQREDHLTLAELAQRTGLPRSTVHRIASELAELGLIKKTSDGYELGLTLFEIGNRAAQTAGLQEIALPYLGALLEMTRQVVNVAVLDGTEVVYVDRLHAKRNSKMRTGIGSRLPAHSTALGKVLLALGPTSVIDDVIKRGLKRYGPNTITDPEVLRRHLDEVRKKHVAFDIMESNTTNLCVAAPIIGFDGKAIAALSVTGFSDMPSLQRAAPIVLENARSLSRNYALAQLERQTRAEATSAQ